MPSPLKAEGRKYRRELDALLEDRRVDVAELAPLLEKALHDSLSEVQAYHLVGWADDNKDSFDAEARRRLEQFLRGKLTGLTKVCPEEGGVQPSEGPLGAEPKVADGDESSVTYESSLWPLEAQGVGSDDPLQGSVGDCYFISAMSAIAAAQPNLIEKAIKKTTDGQFLVTFYRWKDDASPMQPVELKISSSLPFLGKEPRYGSAREHELWPMILEKAYAQWKGGYEEIGFGFATNALGAITGKRPHLLWIFPDDASDQLFETLKRLVSEHACIVASTRSGGDLDSELVRDHAYALLGIREEANRRWVRLRNPWGSGEPHGDGIDDGIFELPWSEFLANYGLLEYVE